jgi:hypothetical protein
MTRYLSTPARSQQQQPQQQQQQQRHRRRRRRHRRSVVLGRGEATQPLERREPPESCERRLHPTRRGRNGGGGGYAVHGLPAARTKGRQVRSRTAGRQQAGGQRPGAKPCQPNPPERRAQRRPAPGNPGQPPCPKDPSSREVQVRGHGPQDNQPPHVPAQQEERRARLTQLTTPPSRIRHAAPVAGS